MTLTGSPMRRIAFSVNGRRVTAAVVPPGRRTVTVSLPIGAVSARVTCRNGASAQPSAPARAGAPAAPCARS